MLRIISGLIFAVAGLMFYWLGTMPDLLGSAVAPAGIHRATGLMWGTALVLFLWFIVERMGQGAKLPSNG
jgi:hypothetical protein